VLCRFHFVNVEEIHELMVYCHTEQSPVKQVEQILRQNKEKILKRSQLKREDYKILGKVQNKKIQNSNESFFSSSDISFCS
jgi:hypothetical protein